MRFAALLLACAGCALPAVTAGTFLPAGDLKSGDLHASASLERRAASARSRSLTSRAMPCIPTRRRPS